MAAGIERYNIGVQNRKRFLEIKQLTVCKLEQTPYFNRLLKRSCTSHIHINPIR